MAARIDLGSLVVPILVVAFTFNPQVVQFLSWFHRLLRSLLTPSSTRCELLLWKDFQPGQLHCHSGSAGGPRCTHCLAASTHEESERCWTSTLALVFDNAYIAWDAKSRKKWAKKPEGLPLGDSFVRTEAKVVLAYFVSTAQVNRFADELLGSRLDYVQLREEKGLMLAHVGRAQRVLDLTKDEVDKILDEWPPFYRKTFMSIEGHALELESPLKSFDQVRRPRWIVAIGLGTVQPTDVFVDRADEPAKTLFGYAIRRVTKVLQDQFLVEWGGNAAVKKAIENVERMVKHGPSEVTGKWTWKADETDMVAYLGSQTVTELTKEQCEALMRVFGQMAITQRDKAIINPALEACMARVSLGVQVALKYTSTDRVLKVPPLLQGLRAIYLRDCEPRDY